MAFGRLFYLLLFYYFFLSPFFKMWKWQFLKVVREGKGGGSTDRRSLWRRKYNKWCTYEKRHLRQVKWVLTIFPIFFSTKTETCRQFHQHFTSSFWDLRVLMLLIKCWWNRLFSRNCQTLFSGVQKERHFNKFCISETVVKSSCYINWKTYSLTLKFLRDSQRDCLTLCDKQGCARILQRILNRLGSGCPKVRFRVSRSC